MHHVRSRLYLIFDDRPSRFQDYHDSRLRTEDVLAVSKIVASLLVLSHVALMGNKKRPKISPSLLWSLWKCRSRILLPRDTQ